MPHDVLMKKTQSVNVAKLDVADLRAALGLPDDAEVKLVPRTNGSDEFDVVAKWTSAPATPTATPAPEPKKDGRKGKATPAPQATPDHAPAPQAEQKPEPKPTTANDEDVP